MAELIDVPAGLAGVAAAETEIGDVVGDRGYYHYRGRAAPELARTSDFETVAGLVLSGDGARLEGDRTLPGALEPLVGRVDLRGAMGSLSGALGLRPLADIDGEEAMADAHRLIAVLPTVIASVLHGRPVEPDPALGHVANYLHLLRGEPASAEQVAALEAYFILTIDHGFNNSTFTTRVVASAGADLGACVLAGFCSLSAPRHGANTERVLAMFDAIGEPDNAEPWMREQLASRQRLQGFGHSVYRKEDPRLTLLRQHGAVVAPERHRLALAAETAGTTLLAGRTLVPNLDLHAPVVLEGCGIPRGWFTATFAAARIVGWCAHAVEQAGQAKILRPGARYVGPPPDADVY